MAPWREIFDDDELFPAGAPGNHQTRLLRLM
jgi:hypothetical protein